MPQMRRPMSLAPAHARLRMMRLQSTARLSCRSVVRHRRQGSREWNCRVEIHVPVQLSVWFAIVGYGRVAFAEGFRVQTACVDAMLDHVVSHGVRAALSKRQIVFHGNTIDH